MTEQTRWETYSGTLTLPGELEPRERRPAAGRGGAVGQGALPGPGRRGRRVARIVRPGGRPSQVPGGPVQDRRAARRGGRAGLEVQRQPARRHAGGGGDREAERREGHRREGLRPGQGRALRAARGRGRPRSRPRSQLGGFPPRIGVRGGLCAGNAMALRRPRKRMKMAVASHGTWVGAGFKPAPAARYGGTVYFIAKTVALRRPHKRMKMAAAPRHSGLEPESKGPGTGFAGMTLGGVCGVPGGRGGRPCKAGWGGADGLFAYLYTYVPDGGFKSNTTY